jgi:hypothetical protein
MADTMFLIMVLLTSLIVAVAMTSGASFAMRYYGRRFEREERRAATVIGASFGLLLPAMYCAENLLPGKPGELVATGLMIAICLIAAGIVWRTLARGRNA